MKKKWVFILIAALLLLGASSGGYYLYQRHQAHSLYEQAQKAYQQKNYPRSLELCQKITTRQLRLLPKLEQANALICAGNCLYEMDKYADSIDYFARAAEIVEKNNLLSKLDAPFRLYTYWGDGLEEKEEYSDAEKVYQHGIELLCVIYGVSSPGIAMLQARLGSLYLYIKQYEKSLKCFEVALANSNYLNAQDDFKKGFLYGSLAAAYCHNNRLNEANAMYLKSIDLIKKCSGDKSGQLAVEYSGLALVYYKQKKLMEAIKLLDLAYDIFREQCGSQDRATIRIAKLREEWQLEFQK